MLAMVLITHLHAPYSNKGSHIILALDVCGLCGIHISIKPEFMKTQSGVLAHIFIAHSCPNKHGTCVGISCTSPGLLIVLGNVVFSSTTKFSTIPRPHNTSSSQILHLEDSHGFTFTCPQSCAFSFFPTGSHVIYLHFITKMDVCSTEASQIHLRQPFAWQITRRSCELPRFHFKGRQSWIFFLNRKDISFKMET